MEWEPLYLTNATFNGKGHTIKNLKLNSSTDIIGFFSGGNIYLYDAKFKNAEIDEIKYRSVSEISLLGSVYADSCTVEGQINVSSIDEIRIYGLNSGVDCQLRIDIAARGSDAHVFGMVNCINCEYEGNICGDCFSKTGMYDCHNCLMYGNVDSDDWEIYGDTYGILKSENCEIYGNITGNGEYTYGIAGSKNCTIEGDIGNYRGTGHYTYCIYESTQCEITGTALGTVKEMDVIYDCTGCLFNGIISGPGNIDAISVSQDCVINGNMVGTGNRGGIALSRNCIINGNISGSSGEVVSGIANGCVDCVINGNISCRCDVIYGIDC